MDSAPYPTRAPIAPPGGSKVTFTPSGPPSLYPATGGPNIPKPTIPVNTPSQPVPSQPPTSPIPSSNSPVSSQITQSTLTPVTSSSPPIINSPSPPASPVVEQAVGSGGSGSGRKFPLMIVTLLLLIISGIFGGYFLFTKYANFGVAKQPNVLESVPDLIDTTNEQTTFSNPFSAPTVAYQNPFAQSPDDYENPFGNYNNPFATAQSETTQQTLGNYKNPFEEVR